MSAKEHDHDHDHSPTGDNTASHPMAPEGPLSATPEHGYWKSLRELEGKAPWQLEPHIKEFEPGTTTDAPANPLSRRNFFHLMGASMGLAGIAAGSGCRRYEKEEIIPLSRRPDGHVPGQVLEYATTFELAGAAQAVVATSFEGRPIHIDGNPDHPFAGGGIQPGTKRHAGASTFAQASILHLYDPDRSRNPRHKSKVDAASTDTSIETFNASLGDIKKTLGPKARVLSEATSSPTVLALRRRLEAAGVVWHEYEPLSWDNERLGLRTAFGRVVRPLAHLDRCETIVTIDCDLFVEHPAAPMYNRDFARSRRKDGSLGVGKMNRLWSAESVMTNTGAMADHRLGMRAELGLPFALALDAALSGGGAPNSEFIKESKVAQFITILAEELKTNAGRSVVLAGRRQPPEVHAVVARINQTIGAVGATLDYLEDPDAERPHHLQSITQLAQDMAASRVDTLIMLGGNPVYDAPADLDFAGALAKVGLSIHLSEYADETSLASTWHLPKAHFLEAWGDARTWDGTISVAQPLITPMWGGQSSAELISLLLGDELSSEQLMRTTVEPMVKGASWKSVVHDGFVRGSAFQPAQVALAGLPAFNLSPTQQTGSRRKNGELEVVYHYSSATYDGRYANNPWLWETPDFLTKVTWDNYALISPETAVALGVKNDDMITVKVGDKSMKLPAYTMPGQAKYSIGLVLGGGRKIGSRSVKSGSGHDRSPGWNTYTVRTTKGFDIAQGATVTNTGDTYTLANVQDHWNYKPGNNKLMNNDDSGGLKFDHEVAIKRSPKLTREITGEELEKDRGWAAEVDREYWDDTKEAEAKGVTARHLSLFEEQEYHGHRWAMAIDLSTCTGCNSCMIACQSENNVPVVGRDEVMNNREMHWIRIDRYFQGTPEEPHVVHQPLGCQQCENAPCEQVCPVGATTHSDEGLNDMAYNRCIGTRYCANNCPYRVRRFNFLDWNAEFRDARNKVRRLLFNPDVTVRSRGVMEKCTFCVQRIQNGKIKAKAQIRNGRRAGAVGAALPDGEIETACQMACPTEAIVFGDLSDAESRVSKLHADRRSYALLPELYTKPRNRYLTRVLNPNPKMPRAAASAGHGGGH